MSFFKWLPEHFEGFAVELGEFVEEQNALVSQGDLAGLGRASAPHQTRVADRVVGRSERPDRHQGLARLQEPHRAVDPGGFKTLGGSQRRHDRRKTLGEECFPRTGRANEQDVVRPGGGDEHRALGVILPLDVGEIFFVMRELFEGGLDVDRFGLDLELAVKESDPLGERADWIDGQSLNHRGLGGVGGGDEDSIAILSARGQGHRENPLDRAGFAGQAQFADDSEVSTALDVELAASHQQSQRDRQVESAGVLLQVGGGEVDDDTIDRPLIAGVDDRAFDTMRALANGGFRQADQDRFRKRGEGDVHLDLDGSGVDPNECVREELGQHE